MGGYSGEVRFRDRAIICYARKAMCEYPLSQLEVRKAQGKISTSMEDRGMEI